MWQLPAPEMTVFLISGLLYVAAGIVGLIQLSPKGKPCARALMPLICLGVCLQAVVLVFRAVDIKAIPLTGLFESMLVLTIVLSLIYIFLSIAIPQVWFGSIMAWTILVLVVLAAVVARPASVATKVAATPWVVFHAIAMVLSSALIVFATASAFLYLLSRHRLKHKQVMTVLGRVPNLEWLRRANRIGLKGCFVAQTVGLACGIGMAAVQSVALDMGFADWMTDPKIVLIAIAWVLLLLILCLRRLAGISDKVIAYITLLLFFLIIFASVGVAVFCGTKHVFVV